MDNQPDFEQTLENVLACADHVERSELLLDLLTSNPTNANTYLELGKCYVELNDFKKAISVIKHSVLLNDDGLGHIWLGHIHMCLHDFINAEMEFIKAQCVMPTNDTPLWLLAELYEEQGKLQESEKLYRKALTLDPDVADTHARLGQLLIKCGRHEEAFVSLKWALCLDPECDIAIELVEEHGLGGSNVVTIVPADEQEHYQMCS